MDGRLSLKMPFATPDIETAVISTSRERSLNFVSPTLRSKTSSRTAGTPCSVRSVGSDIETSTDRKSHRTRIVLKVVLFIISVLILSKYSYKIKFFIFGGAERGRTAASQFCRLLP